MTRARRILDRALRLVQLHILLFSTRRSSEICGHRDVERLQLPNRILGLYDPLRTVAWHGMA
jgi:hypothetical protein